MIIVLRTIIPKESKNAKRSRCERPSITARALTITSTIHQNTTAKPSKRPPLSSQAKISNPSLDSTPEPTNFREISEFSQDFHQISSKFWQNSVKIWKFFLCNPLKNKISTSKMSGVRIRSRRRSRTEEEKDTRASKLGARRFQTADSGFSLDRNKDSTLESACFRRRAMVEYLN